MMLFGLFFLIATVRGQLSVDELFYFKSKHAISGNCSDLQYRFVDIRIGPMIYNRLEFDCDRSSILFRNNDQVSTTNCPNGEGENQDFQLRFDRSIPILSTNQTVIHVKPLHLNGIDLSSLDDRIRNVYLEHSYYHSRWALLIDIESDNNNEQRHHFALATDGEMTFLVCIFLPDDNPILIKNEIEIVFSNENFFRFNRSKLDIWRIDQGFVHYAKSSIPSNSYQLSKSIFSLYNNETFLLYGIEQFYSRRLFVTIDKTSVVCRYRDILSCTFPVLPLNTSDTHRPQLRIIHNFETIVNTTLALIPRTRLGQVQKKQNFTTMSTCEVKIDENLCSNHSLASVFTFIIHMRYDDINGTILYRIIEDEKSETVNCGQSLQLGQQIVAKIAPISIDDVLSIDIDLTHQWSGQDNCRVERTRIHFAEEVF